MPNPEDELVEAAIEKMCREVVRVSQDAWDLPADEWDRETFKMQGVWEEQEAAFKASRLLIERALLEKMLFFVHEKRVKGNTIYRQHPMSQLPRDFAKENGIDLSEGEG